MKHDRTTWAKARIAMENGLCPLCGAEDSEPELGCPDCAMISATCALCGEVVCLGEKGKPCKCVVAIFGYGPGEWRSVKRDFKAWKRRELRGGPIFKGEEPWDDPSEVTSLAKETGWIKVMVVGDDGAFGHSNPDVYFLVRPEDQHRMKHTT